jgi:hypothetical protein
MGPPRTAWNEHVLAKPGVAWVNFQDSFGSGVDHVKSFKEDWINIYHTICRGIRLCHPFWGSPGYQGGPIAMALAGERTTEVGSSSCVHPSTASGAKPGPMDLVEILIRG